VHNFFKHILTVSVLLIVGCIGTASIDHPDPTPTIINPLLVAPDAPSELGVEAQSSTQIELVWKDNAGNEDGFVIKRTETMDLDFTEVARVSADVTSFRDAGLVPEQTMFYIVHAFNSVGFSESSNTANATTFALPEEIPNSPTNLLADAVGPHLIEMSWDDNSDNEEGFRIERSLQNDTGFLEIDVVYANILSYEDSSVEANTTYYYRVYAFNSAGDSENYAQDSATTPPEPAPDAPTNWTATGITHTQIRLDWQDNSNNESGFKIERSDSQSGPFDEIDTVGTGIRTYSNSGLESETTYYYRVRAYNGSGDSSYTNIADGTTLSPPDPSNIKLDFDKAGDVYTEPGYTSFVISEYSDAHGYGWANTSGIGSYKDSPNYQYYDYNDQEALFIDGHYSYSAGEFKVKLDPGYYRVRLILCLLESMNTGWTWRPDVEIEGHIFGSSTVSMSMSIYDFDRDKVFGTFVPVTDGILNIKFLDDAMLNGLEIESLTNPEITQAPSEIDQGETVDIYGDNFGDKVGPEPLYWLDFEDGSEDEQPITYPGWWARDDGPQFLPPHFWSGNTYAGNWAGRSYYNGNGCTPYNIGGGIMTEVIPFTEFFASYRYYMHTIEGAGSNNIKMMRLVSAVDVEDGSTDDPYHGAPSMRHSRRSTSWAVTIEMCNDGQEKQIKQGAHAPAFDVWNRGDYYIKESSLDIFDGTNAIIFNNDDVLFNDRFLNDDCEEADYKNWWLPYYYRDSYCTPGQPAVNEDYQFEVLYDQVYGDNTQARVEICDSEHWHDRTDCEIQYPTQTWQSDHLRIRVEKGRFSNGETVFLYIVDANGSVNDPGYQLMFAP